jgi:hypothetical protein
VLHNEADKRARVKLMVTLQLQAFLHESLDPSWLIMLSLG